MNRWYILFTLIGVAVIGLLSIAHKLIIIPKRRQKTIDYHNELMELINSALEHGNIKQDLYIKLLEESGAMQRELGSDGLYAYMHDPLKRLTTSDYQLLANFFEEIRLYLSSERNDYIMRERFRSLAGSCSDSFIRHGGTLIELHKLMLKQIINPFAWIFEGMKIIISLPILLLSTLGVVSAKGVEKARESWIIKMLGAIVTLAGIISSIMSIVMGWDEFWSLFS